MIKLFSDTLKRIFGTKADKDVATYQPIVDKIHDAHSRIQQLSNDELRQQTLVFRERIATYLEGIDRDIEETNAKAIATEDVFEKEQLFKQVDEYQKERNTALEVILKEILPEAFAVVKEAASRFTNNGRVAVTPTEHDRMLAGKGKTYVTIEGDQAFWSNSWKAAGGEIIWNMVHYDVQLIGGMVLHDGKIAEMATGEGKTLVATLPAYLNGLSGRGVHIVTVNDYLARRDSEWVGPLFEFLFLTVDCIDKYQPNTDERRAAYQCDITYGTNNEFGFDYLRDNMVRSKDEQVQRKHHYAMVDEVDSVLIDDARTPLIISGPVPKGHEDQEYEQLKPSIERLINEQRNLATKYLAEAKSLIKDKIVGYNEGEAGLSLLRAYRALPKNRALIKFLSEEGVRTELNKAENYYMQEQSKNMHKVDVPLLFTIDEKNRQVQLTEFGAHYLAKGGEDPNFFVMPDVAGALVKIDQNIELSNEQKKEEKDKLAHDFAVKSRRLHSVNQLLKAYTLFEKDEEYIVVNGEVKIVDEQTGRVMEGRRYSDGLHQAIEAKENVRVGELTQTYATVTLQNYFRMYHKLAGMTGTAETEARELWEIYKLDVVVIPTNRNITRKDEQDLVYKTAREKINAVIEEIEKLRNAGRPILVGTTSVDISEKLSRMLQMRGIEHNVLNAKQHQREAEIVAEAGQAGKVTIATNMAGRGTDIKLGPGVKESGGLAIIGTERHESRRVDRQLRGRAGRQGDPGSSQFYVSLEDNLMRLFQAERISKLMDRMGHKEGEVLQHSMVTKSIENAQKKVEENNFGIRKRLLEYDDVMNIQREAIYKKRSNALNGDRLEIDLYGMFDSQIELIAKQAKQNGNFDEFRLLVFEKLGNDPDIQENEFQSMNAQQLDDRLRNEFYKFYNSKNERIRELLMPLITQVHTEEGHKYKRIALPYTDGSTAPIVVYANLEAAVQSNGKSIARDIEQTIALGILDEEWKEHLRSMDELKDAVQSASFEQKDPLVIYKMEAYQLFKQLIFRINEQVTEYLAKGSVFFPSEDNPNPQPMKVREPQKQKEPQLQTNREDESELPEPLKKSSGPVQTQVRVEPKVGRNDPCPCGSGKKYKHCHGVNA